jgi:hypothetical protein
MSKARSNVWKLRDAIVLATDPEWGAKGDGTTDDFAALTSFVNHCMSTGRIGLIPPGDYNLNGQVLVIDTSANSQKGLRLLGCFEHTIIRQTDANLPCAIRTGRNQSIDGIMWRHSTMPTSANTRGCGWEISGLLSQFNDGWNKFYKVYSAIQPAAAGVNAMFAGQCDHIMVHQYAGEALNLKGLNGGNTPTHFPSVYTSNLNDDGTTRNSTTQPVINIQTADGPIFGHLHIENVKATTLIFVGSDVDGVVIGSLHIENFEASANGQIIDAAGNSGTGRFSGVKVHHLQMLSCLFQFATMAVNTYALFRVGAGAQVIVDHISERSNTIDITDFRVARGSSPDINSAVWVNSGNVITATGGTYTTVILTADTSQDSNSGLPSLLRRWLGSDYFRINDLGAANVYEHWTATDADPSVGTWTRGSKRHFESPVAGGNVGRICVTAGTPGTWAQFGHAVNDGSATFDPPS